MNSVVFRGLTTETSGHRNGFDSCLKTIRKWHDGEIIVSTWDSDPLLFDKKMIDTLVLSKDPGWTGKVFGWEDSEEMRNWPEKGGANHVNTIRQLTLANAGVKASTGKNTLLTRTDFRHGKNLFNIQEKDPNKIIIPCVGTIWPDFKNLQKKFLRKRPRKEMVRFSKKERSCPFHFSDLFQCGTTENIKNWASNEVMSNVISNIWTCRSIEQLWSCSYLNGFRGYKFDFKDLEKDAKKYWQVLLENFIVVGTWESRSISMKYEYRNRVRRRPNSKFYIWPKHYKEKIEEFQSSNFKLKEDK